MYSKGISRKTKLASLEVRTRPAFLETLISKYDFGPVKLPGLSRNGPLPVSEISVTGMKNFPYEHSSLHNYKDIHHQSYNKTIQTNNIPTIKNNLQKNKMSHLKQFKKASAGANPL